MATLPSESTSGIVLAAGAGSRMGMPKALMHDADGTSWLRRAVEVLRDGGCSPVYAVLGAEAERAVGLLSDIEVEVVVAADWATGISASLRAGLAAVRATSATSVVVLLVDTPDVGADVVARVLRLAGADSRAGADSLVRAVYAGTPGHPALIGRDHWSSLAATATGDNGAQGYFQGRPHQRVECGDLASGRDRDRPSR
ncbi:MAG: nucleotidyltransferase family protein [Nocardioides sp.]